MLRTTTLLTVAILAAGPVGSLGCELWCSSPAVVDHYRGVGCDDASRTSPLGPQLTSTIGCHDAAAIAPFIAEVRRAESAPVATAAVALFDTSSIAPDNDKTAAGWWAFEVQPPPPPSFRPVLRV